MRQPLADPFDPDVSAVVRTIRRQRWGRVSALYGMLLHHPAIAEGWVGLGSAVRRHTRLDDRIRELVICVVASVCAQSYEWESHTSLARRAGVTANELGQLLDRGACPTFSDHERVVLDLAEDTARDRVTDASFRRAADVLAPDELVEVVATAAYYVGTARFLSAFGIEAGAANLVDAEEAPPP